MMPEYEDLTCRLIVELNEAEHGDHLPDFWKPERDAQRVCIAVCDATKMTPDWWARLTEAERVPWLKKTLASLRVVEDGAALDPDRLVAASDIAPVVHLAAATVSKTYAPDWGDPVITHSGTRSAKWRLGDIRPIVEQHFAKVDWSRLPEPKPD